MDMYRCVAKFSDQLLCTVYMLIERRHLFHKITYVHLHIQYAYYNMFVFLTTNMMHIYSSPQ